MARAVETVHAEIEGREVTIQCGLEYPDSDPAVLAHPEWFEDVKPAPKKAAVKPKGE